MPKKIDEAEVKKECPSCGLGVALDSRICEFCGWDFEEEDEWILQIEKLERDLMLEKQKFEPGTVNERIESTLHTPILEQREGSKSASKPISELPKTPAPSAVREVTPQLRKPIAAPPPSTEKPTPVKSGPPVRAVEQPPERQPQATAPSKVRRMRVAKSTPSEEAGGEVGPKKKLVRKVKQ